MKYILFLLLASIYSNAVAQELLPELEIKKIEEGVYLHTSYEKFGSWGVVASNGLISVHGKSAVIIDTPVKESDNLQLLNWLDDQHLAVDAVIAAHFHVDSTAGIALFNSKNIPTYATALTNRLLAKMSHEQAKNAIESDSFWLSDHKVEMYYPGGGHTQDNIVVWLADKKILFGGCFVKPEYIGNLEDAVLPAWPTSMQSVITKYPDVKWVVPGHGNFGDKTLLDKTLDIVNEALSNAADKS